MNDKSWYCQACERWHVGETNSEAAKCGWEPVTEFVCILCGCKVTRGPSGTEYGHARYRKNGDEHFGRCPQRPAAVDPGKGNDGHHGPTPQQAVADGGRDVSDSGDADD